MGRFFSLLIATFISVLGALTTWHFAQTYLTQIEAEKVAAEVDATHKQTKRVAEKIIDKMKYEWKFEERTNPVTGEKVATATRFSEDIGSALTFRCYGFNNRRFDILVSFPEAIDWGSSSMAMMRFKLDGGELTEIFVHRRSSSVASPNLADFLKDEKEVREFNKIGSASLFEASITDGTIYDQTISIDLNGINEAIKPVLALCGKAST